MATRIVSGVAKSGSGEGRVLPWQTHVCTVGVFSKVEKLKGTGFIKRVEIISGKIGGEQVPTCLW